MQYFLRSLLASGLVMGILLGSYRLLYGNGTEKEASVSVMVQYGDYGDTVIAIKRRLKELGYEIEDMGADYDLKTADAVRRFQEDSGIYADGTVTPETMVELGLKATLHKLIDYERERFLATVIDAVYPDAPYLVRVALAGVILNRCETAGFPSDPVSVVFGEPMLRDAYLAHFENEPSLRSREAVKDAYEGLSPCPSALYCFQSGTSDTFLKQRAVVYRNGSYIFAE